MNKNITVLGLGNPLLKDDGIGPRVIAAMQKEGLLPGVQAVSSQGSFYQLLNIIAESKRIIAVDALQGGSPPGTIYLLDSSKVVRNNNTEIIRHEENFFEVLDLYNNFGNVPEVTIVGIEPKEIAYSTELSPEISARIPALISVIKSLLKPKMNNSLLFDIE